jgi:hypothetical protein
MRTPSSTMSRILRLLSRFTDIGRARAARCRLPLDQHARTARRSLGWRWNRPITAVRGEGNSNLVSVLANEIRVTRDVFLSVHEEMEFMVRVRTVCRHIESLFASDRGFLIDL